jgi:hypothetical protein
MPIEEDGRYDGLHQSHVGIDHTYVLGASAPPGNLSDGDGRVVTVPSRADCASASNTVRLVTHISTQRLSGGRLRRRFAAARDLLTLTGLLNGGVRSLCPKT